MNTTLNGTKPTSVPAKLGRPTILPSCAIVSNNLSVPGSIHTTSWADRHTCERSTPMSLIFHIIRSQFRHTVSPSVAVLLYLLITQGALIAQPNESDNWVATWATALVERREAPQRSTSPEPNAPQEWQPILVRNPDIHVNNQTLRQIVRTSVGGEKVRVVASNVFGTEPLDIGAARLALRTTGSTIDPTSVRTLTFSGRSVTTVLAGAVAISDPITLEVPAIADLAIDFYLPGNTASRMSPLTTHSRSLNTNYLSTAGDHTGETDIPVQTLTESWFFLSRVEVTAPANTGVVVAIGDSITDGYGATVDANNSWPEQLARRFQLANIPIAVANVGIGGNRVLGDGAGVSALARFDRDVLVQTGVSHVIVLEGINDIGALGGDPSPSPEALIAGHKQLIARAHAQGLKIFGATLTPYEGTVIPGYWTARGDETRQALNQWIRTSGDYDAVIDFDAATRNPNQPMWLLERYDVNDHLHPNDAGYKAMADAIDLALFTAP